MTQTAYQYVTDELELVQEADETVQEYLERVAYTFQEMDEKAWDKLPVSCQQWYNDAADVLVAKNEAESNDQEFTGALAELPGMSKSAPKAVKPKEKKPVPVVSKTEAVAEALEDAAEAVADAAEAVEAAAEVVAEAAEDSATEDSTATPKKSRGRPKGSQSTPKEERAAKAEKQPRGPIAAASVRKLMCENMDLTLDEVMTKLAELGVEMQRSSCQVVHLNTVRAFEMAVEMGFVKNKSGTTVLTDK